MTDEGTRAKRLERLRKLLALAKGNASEAEAMAAIGKAHDYADRFGLSMDEARQKEKDGDVADYRAQAFYSGETDYDAVDKYLWRDIAKFCCVRVTNTADGETLARDEDGDLVLIYQGEPADVELAIWLRATARAAMRFEWEVYRDFVYKREVPLNVAMQSFHRGFADKARARMEAHERRAAPTGKELVVVKQALLVQAAEAHGWHDPFLGRGSRARVDGAAYGAGEAAGGRVDIGRGVAQGGNVKMIGRS